MSVSHFTFVSNSSFFSPEISVILFFKLLSKFSLWKLNSLPWVSLSLLTLSVYFFSSPVFVIIFQFFDFLLKLVYFLVQFLHLFTCLSYPASVPRFLNRLII